MVVILVSGEIATGKTAVATALARWMPADLVKVREALSRVLGVAAQDRQELQRRGADLDRRTSGRWLRDYIEEHHPHATAVVVDALRTRRQTIPILERFVDSRLVFLEAHEETRRSRYREAAATDPIKASVDFETAMRHPTELEVVHLRAIAQLVVATDDLKVNEVVTEVITGLKLDVRPS
jgi:cytidylate kinase